MNNIWKENKLFENFISKLFTFNKKILKKFPPITRGKGAGIPTKPIFLNLLNLKRLLNESKVNNLLWEKSKIPFDA